MNPATPGAVRAARLAPEWQDWLAGSVVRGCTDAEMVANLCDNGFDEQYARVAISVVRSMAERLREQSPAALSDYTADPIRLPAGNRLDAAGREVTVGLRLGNPNIALLEGLMSANECDELVRMSGGKLRPSEVVDPDSGRLEVSGVRRSEGAHFQRGENELVAALETRVAALTSIPVECGEPLQILHYPPGGEYLAHHDYFDPADPGSAGHLERGGQRVATLVVYLNRVEEGGQTRFPDLDVEVGPMPGRALYFEYFNRRGEVDPRCLHAGAPVARGEKWIATKWLRERPYHR